MNGSGTGAFDSALWHLQGSGDDPGENYNCDPPVNTSGFTVEVSGFVQDGVPTCAFGSSTRSRRMRRWSARTVSSPAHSTTSYLAASLQAVQPGGHHDSAPAAARGHRPRKRRARRSSGPNDPRAEICTITGNRRNNVLTGTPEDDIICGFGGRDRIKGLGGNDIIFGGPGPDVITGGSGLDSLYGNSGGDLLKAKDGLKDLVDGGPGTDIATRDRIDRVRGVP